MIVPPSGHEISIALLLLYTVIRNRHLSRPASNIFDDFPPVNLAGIGAGIAGYSNCFSLVSN